jgi:hypothetical protein
LIQRFTPDRLALNNLLDVGPFDSALHTRSAGLKQSIRCGAGARTESVMIEIHTRCALPHALAPHPILHLV